MKTQLCEWLAKRTLSQTGVLARASTSIIALLVLLAAGCATDRQNHRSPTWQSLLEIPVASQTAALSEAVSDVPLSTLRPAPELLVKQPGDIAPGKRITAARSEDGRLLLAYTPEQQTIELRQRDLPRGFKMEWLNPRDGKRSGVVGVVNSDNLLLTPPAQGDWLLLVIGK